NLQPHWKTKLFTKFLAPSENYVYKKDINSSLHAWQNFSTAYFHPADLHNLSIKQFNPFLCIPQGVIQSTVAHLELDETKELIAFIPGVGKHRPHRAWPLQNWLSLFKILETRENQKYQIVLVGGPDEVDLCDELILQLPNISKNRLINLAGKLNLLGTAAILSKASVVIGSDTGPTHIAGALGKKVIGLYGPTSATRHAPFTGISVEADDYTCAETCTSKKCARKVMTCMNAIKPEEVWLLMKELQTTNS
ncbi:MAG TPA: glycosyltransferase family 9 protein, partial [Vampirovibrionales bacterium]